MLETGKIYQSDALEVLRQMPSESVDSCVTSPPYFQQRNYQVEGQLGQENSPNYDRHSGCRVKRIFCLADSR